MLPLVYDELRKLAAAKMAQEKPDQTLQATALVHEAYIRLVDVDKAQHWNSRGHFFVCGRRGHAADSYQSRCDKNRAKRGGHLRKFDFASVELALEAEDEELLAVDEAIEQLAIENRMCRADLVLLRFYAGLSMKEAAAALGCSGSTADRNWAYARAWLYDALNAGNSNDCYR